MMTDILTTGPLTRRASAKLRRLETEVADLQAVARASTLRAGELRSSMAFLPSPPQDVQKRLAEMSADGREAYRDKDEFMSPEAVERKAEIDRLESHAGVQHAKASTALQLVTNIKHWLTTLPQGVLLRDVDPIKVEHQNFQEAASAVRVEIGELDAKLRRIRNAAPTKKERDALAERYARDLVARAQPKISASHAKLDIAFGIDGALQSKAAVASALIAWAVGPEQISKRIIAALDAQPEAPLLLSTDEKTQQVKALNAEILAESRLEEAIIELAAKHDTFLSRRPTASPLAVLGLEMVTADAKKATAA